MRVDDVRAYELRNGVDGVVHKYELQRQGARERGIEWLFDLKSWLEVWDGKIAKRGRGLRAMCMCRHNDEGPYATWNVRIATGYENKLDWWEKRPKWFKHQGVIRPDGFRRSESGIEQEWKVQAQIEMNARFGSK